MRTTKQWLDGIEPFNLKLRPRQISFDELDKAVARLEEQAGHYEALIRDGDAAIPAFMTTMYQPSPGKMSLREAVDHCHHMLRYDKGLVIALRRELAGQPRPVRMFA